RIPAGRRRSRRLRSSAGPGVTRRPRSGVFGCRVFGCRVSGRAVSGRRRSVFRRPRSGVAGGGVSGRAVSGRRGGSAAAPNLTVAPGGDASSPSGEGTGRDDGGEPPAAAGAP